MFVAMKYDLGNDTDEHNTRRILFCYFRREQ